jgi:hypothetical protein
MYTRPAALLGMTRLLPLLMSLLSLPLAAKPICRWVDGNGRTQFSDVVPARYRDLATCTDSQKHELPPQQRRAAEQPADGARAKAVPDAAKAPARAASGASREGVAPQRVAKRPSETVTETTDCATWWRLYEESAACFGPFRTSRGATKSEAFDVCNEIPSPEPKCGFRTR